MERREFLWLAGLAAAARSVRAAVPQSPSAPTRNRVGDIAGLITARMTEYHVPGVAFGLLKNGELTLRGFGVTNVDDPQPVTPETLLTIASISKTVTTTAIMRLVEMGRVELKAPVSKYLPDFHVQDDAVSREVSVWHLLTHTPGWEGQISAEDRGNEALAHFA